MEKKKLLFIVEAMGGGVFTYIVDLANELSNSYDMYIAYAIRPQTPTDFKDYFNKDIHLVEVKNFTRSVSFINDVKAFFEIRKIVENIRPDIIHLHSSKAGALGRWVLNGKKIPMFYTPHGYSFLMSDSSMIKRNIYKMVEKVSSKRNCTTISCSKGEHLETLRFTNNAYYVNNGINVDELDSLLSTVKVENNDIFTVYTLGRICYQKNPTLFNEIALSMPDIHFLWIGDGELRNELSAPNIEITGWLDRREALSKSLSANAFLLTSLWEGLPLSLLESMYMNKPCVVNNVIGNNDVIENNRNGFVCNHLNDYINAINNIKEGKADELIENAYEDILKEYNTKIMAQKYDCIYKESLKTTVRGGVTRK